VNGNAILPFCRSGRGRAPVLRSGVLMNKRTLVVRTRWRRRSFYTNDRSRRGTTKNSPKIRRRRPERTDVLRYTGETPCRGSYRLLLKRLRTPVVRPVCLNETQRNEYATAVMNVTVSANELFGSSVSKTSGHRPVSRFRSFNRLRFPTRANRQLTVCPR